MKLLTSIFTVKNKERNVFQIIAWWELRRLVYNIILVLGIVLCLEFLKIDLTTVEMGSGEYIIFLMLVAFAVSANFIYTFGWIIEIFIQRSSTYGPTIFKGALLLTVLSFAVFAGWLAM